MNVRACVHSYVFGCVCVRACVRVCVYAHTHPHAHTHTHTRTHTHTHTNTCFEPSGVPQSQYILS